MIDQWSTILVRWLEIITLRRKSLDTLTLLYRSAYRESFPGGRDNQGAVAMCKDNYEAVYREPNNQRQLSAGPFSGPHSLTKLHSKPVHSPTLMLEILDAEP